MNEELRALAEKATPGPRTVSHMDGPVTWFGDSHWNVRAADPDDPETGPQITTSGVRAEAEARYCAAANPAAILDLLARLELAERVCVMFGWTAAHHDSDRDKAAHELWVEWLNEYRRQGGTTDPPDHPDLSDERIAKLARRRDQTVERTLAGFRR